MATRPYECKITVVKRMTNGDLVKEYLDHEGDVEQCERFSDMQEIIVEHPYRMPEGFCPWAWADIRERILAVATGASPPWLKQEGMMLAGCTDWFRPVIFKIERIEV